MKKSVKGAIAAGAAGVLLLGGAGTLAYWSDTGTIVGGSVEAGTLSLGETSCDEGWVYAAGNAGVGEAATLIVPGDTITKDCTFTVNATGDNLEATLTIPATTAVNPDGGTTLVANVGVEYVSDGVAIDDTITSENNGNTVTATINVEFPFGTEETENANDMQGVVAALDDIPITLTQEES